MAERKDVLHVRHDRATYILGISNYAIAPSDRTDAEQWHILVDNFSRLYCTKPA